MPTYNTKDKSLIDTAETLMENGTRVRVRYLSGAEAEGYIRLGKDEERPLVVWNVRSRRGRPLDFSMVSTISHSNQQKGGQIWPEVEDGSGG